MKLIIPLLIACGIALAADDAYMTALSYYYDQNSSNDKTALRILTKESDHGNSDAAFLIAVAYDQGTIVEKAADKALQWYEKAAKLGDVDATMITGWRYYKGEGCEKNTEKAEFWFNKAVKQGDKEAEELLRILHESSLF